MQLGVHEKAELHELLTFKTICFAKSSMMKGIARDEQLQELLRQDIETSEQHIQELRRFLQ